MSLNDLAKQAVAERVASLMNENNVPAKDLVDQLCQAQSNVTRMHAEYQGKAMSDEVYDTFATLRDDRIPELKRAIRAALAAAPVAQPPATAEAVGGFWLAPMEWGPELERAWLDAETFEKGWAAVRRAALAAQPPAPVLQTEAVASRDLIDLLKDALASVEDYRSGLNFGAYDRKLIGRLKAALATPPAPALPPVARVPLREIGVVCIDGSIDYEIDPATLPSGTPILAGIEASTGEQS